MYLSKGKIRLRANENALFSELINDISPNIFSGKNIFTKRIKFISSLDNSLAVLIK
jgi:hypothetical protein